MLLVQQGDVAAFEVLMDRYKRPVLNLVYRFIRDAIEAEDIAQAVFIQAYKAADRYRLTAKFSTWIFTIARNLSLNEIRRRKRHPADSLDADPSGEESRESRQIPDAGAKTPLESTVDRELVEVIEATLDELPEQQRSAIVLYQEQGLPYEEIGAILGVSLSAVKSMIHRGREILKSRIKPYLSEGNWKKKSP